MVDATSTTLAALALAGLNLLRKPRRNPKNNEPTEDAKKN